MGLITDDEELSESDINKILRNILYYSRQKNISVFKMGIVGAGEPLLNFDKIKYIIEYAKREDVNNIFAFYIITNGTLVNEDMLAFFYDNKQRITLNFSLDSYEKLHNYGKEAFQKTLTGIKLFEAVFQEKPILNCTVSRQTLNNQEAVVSYFIEHGFRKVNFSQLIDVNSNDLTITHQEFLNFLQFVQDTKAIDFRQNRKEKKYDCRSYGQLCGVGRTNIVITKQGIYPCYRFYKNDEYKIADFDVDLFEVESNMLKKIKPVKDGECYFDKHILNRSDL
jgi:uncharacterized protein